MSASLARPPPVAPPPAPTAGPTPSQRDGLSVIEEKQKRRKTCFYLDECGIALKLPKLPVMTAQCFFHRFFAKESFRRHDRFVVAQACLFLAAKVEESAVALKHLVPTCHRVRYAGRAGAEAPADDSDAGRELKRKVLEAERSVLYAIGFDVIVENPLLYFIHLVRRLHEGGVITGPQQQQFSQIGINFIGDSYRTSLCLQHEPQKVASACGFLTIVFMRALPPREEPKKTARLFQALAISERSLKSICTQMVELYLENKKCVQLVRDLAHMGHVPREFAQFGGPAGSEKVAPSSSSVITPSPDASLAE